MEGWIVTHPYMTMLAILGLVYVVVMALRTLFGRSHRKLEGEKRRLDESLFRLSQMNSRARNLL